MTDPMHQPADRGELALLRQLRQLLPPVIADADIPFGDDMAPVPTGGLLWTIDTLTADVDFVVGKHPWSIIGRKAMAANLSDCAAMAVQPLAALCSVVLPTNLEMSAAVDLLRGAHDCGVQFNCPLVGGDTNSWDHPAVISICIIGRPWPDCSPARRDGAQPGDHIWLSGPVGGSILGRHLTFEPRIELGARLARSLPPHALIDISDGLALDLWRIAQASGCGAEIDESALDALIHPDARQLAQQDGAAARDHALHDGEDFELIVVLPANAPAETCAGLGLHPLGRMIEPPELTLVSDDGRRTAIPPRGWEHLQ